MQAKSRSIKYKTQISNPVFKSQRCCQALRAWIYMRTKPLKLLMFAISGGNVCLRNLPLLHWEWKSSITVSGLLSSWNTWRKSCPVNHSNGGPVPKQKKPETQKAWSGFLSLKKKKNGVFFFPGNKKPVQHVVPGGENKGCYFSLMTALGSEIEHSG